MATTPYADATYAQTYFDERLNTEAWDIADNTTRVKALKTATRAIDRLNFAGVKNDSAQPNQFPRGSDTDVPEAIKKACCELALALLDGVDPNLEAEGVNLLNTHIGEAGTTYDRSFGQPHILAGIPSIQAWHLLLPFLRDDREVRKVRG
jgi:hypothetical protein